MNVRVVGIALGCSVSPIAPPRADRGTAIAGSSSNNEPSSQEREEVLASESWEVFEERCRSPAKIIPINEVEEALAALRDDAALARATVVWKKGNGSARERLLLIRSCARLGRQDMVLGLLPHNLDTELFCEDLFLDAVRSDKPTVVQGLLRSRLFEPARGFLGYALAECGAARSAGGASCLINDQRCIAQALRQCDHERFDLPPWSYLRVLESAIAKAVEAGATKDRTNAPLTSGASISGGDHECLRLLTSFAQQHLQDGEWQRILRQAILTGEEGPICAILRVCPRLLLQAERLQFCFGSQGAATQRTLGYSHFLGPEVQDLS